MGSSQARDGTYVPSIGRRILNHWTTREVPTLSILLKDCSSRIPVGPPEGNSEMKVGRMKYRFHPCSWSWSHTDTHQLLPPWSILDHPQLPPGQVSMAHTAGPHHRRGRAPGRCVLPRPGWLHMSIYHHSWGREWKEASRRIIGCHTYSSMPAVMSPDIKVKCFYPVGTPFLVSHSLEQKESEVLSQPLQHVVQRDSCCVLSSHHHGEVLPGSTVTWLRAISCCRHHSELAAHHDTRYTGYRRIFQNLQWLPGIGLTPSW